MHGIAYIQNPCPHILLQTRFLKSRTSKGLQTKHNHTTLAYHTQRQELECHTPYILQKCRCYSQNKQNTTPTL